MFRVESNQKVIKNECTRALEINSITRAEKQLTITFTKKGKTVVHKNVSQGCNKFRRSSKKILKISP